MKRKTNIHNSDHLKKGGQETDQRILAELSYSAENLLEIYGQICEANVVLFFHPTYLLNTDAE